MFFVEKYILYARITQPKTLLHISTIFKVIITSDTVSIICVYTSSNVCLTFYEKDLTLIMYITPFTYSSLASFL